MTRKKEDKKEHPHTHHKKHDIDYEFAVLTISSSRDEKEDESGNLIKETIKDNEYSISDYSIVDDDKKEISKKILELLKLNIDTIITTGGTGLTSDDVSIEAINPLFDKEIPGFGEYFRTLSLKEVGTSAILTRATAGIIENTVVFVLPGSKNAAKLGTEKIIIPEIDHILYLIKKE